VADPTPLGRLGYPGELMEAMAAADDGCRLWTARSGAGGPLVLCHGGPGWWDTFADLAGLLGRAATAHRWDQRGCGRSERRGPYTLARSLADLDAVRRHHGLGRTVLLGHSWGAELALAFALAHPDQVTALVYVSGTGIDPNEPWHDQFERNLRDRLGRHLHRWAELRRRPARSAAEDRELLVLQLSADFADRGRALEHAERQATPWFGVNQACNRTLGAELRRRRRHGELAAACRALAVPTLIVDGAADLRPRWAVDSLERALPGAHRVVLADAGHFPWVEDPGGFTAAVTGFLAGTG
jgi:proline iminopeptidase